MNAKHTPGPWTTHRTKDQMFPEIRAGSVSIADIRRNGHNEIHGEANARLIAAAPETAAERDRLKAINAELVGALELMLAKNEAMASRFGNKWPAGCWHCNRTNGGNTMNAHTSSSNTDELVKALKKSVQAIDQLCSTVNTLSNKLGLGDKVRASDFSEYARAAIAKANERGAT